MSISRNAGHYSHNISARPLAQDNQSGSHHRSAEVLYAGPQGDFAGLNQINVRVPRSLAGRGEVDIALTVDGQAANVVKVNIQ